MSQSTITVNAVAREEPIDWAEVDWAEIGLEAMAEALREVARLRVKLAPFLVSARARAEIGGTS